jgi:hypothetical protein
MKPALILFERSGVVRRAFRAAGIPTFSCDLVSADDGSPDHYQKDAFELLNQIEAGRFSFVGMRYPCTFLAVSGIHRNKNNPERQNQTERALWQVRELFGAMERAKVPGYFENPVAVISTRIRKPDQIVQPYEFGDDASKKTCLWIFGGLPPLMATGFCAPRYVCCGQSFDYGAGKYGCAYCGGANKAKPRWSNQTDSGQNRIAPSQNRAAIRSQTYPGISTAIARQWGPLIRGTK